MIGNGMAPLTGEQVEVLLQNVRVTGPAQENASEDLAKKEERARMRMARMYDTMREALRLQAAAAEKLAEAIQEIMDAICEAWEGAKQDVQDMLDALANIEFEPEEPEDRHDGALLILTAWAPPTPQMRHLYGQGVDYGGPG